MKSYIVSLLNSKHEISFNLAMFPPEKLEQAKQMLKSYGHAYETGYPFAALRQTGSQEYLEIVTVGAP